MGGSFRLFSVRGIAIRIHITFPLILIWGAIQFGFLANRSMVGAIFGIIVTLLLFAIVVLHELGHSFAAQFYGVRVRQIVLLPLGGVAQLEEIPENPLKEFVIALAGPAVNVILAILMGLIMSASGGRLALQNPATILNEMIDLNFGAIFSYIFVTNIFLAVFNLIPAFPMDGGRVLRALLATRLPYTRATDIAASIGQSVAWLLGLWGFLGGGFFAILIAVFVYLGAGQERQLVRLRHLLGDITVDQVYSRQAQTVTPQTTLREVVELTMSSFQSDFPICEDGNLVGLLLYTDLVAALNEHGPELTVEQVMQTDLEAVDPQEEIFVVQQRLSRNRLSSLPVARDGRFLGLITSQDINEAYLVSATQPELLKQDRTSQT